MTTITSELPPLSRIPLLRFASSLQVDPSTRQATWRDRPLALSPRVFELLLALARTPGHIVERDVLLDTVWPDTFVSDASLTQAVSTLRKALGDDPAARALIVTVPGRGYQLADRLVDGPTPRETSDDSVEPIGLHSISILVAAMLFAGSAWLWHSHAK